MSRSPQPVILALVLAIWGCGASDPREIDGAIRYMAASLEADSSARLFRVIDARSRHAMISIVHDRLAAAQAIRDHYPRAEQERALAELGDAAQVTDAAALFVARCGMRCRRDIRDELGAVDQVEGDELDVSVHTVRGTTLYLHRLHAGDWWGLVWRTEELDLERARAAEERRSIEANAEVYARAEQLERGAATREPAQ